jgi:hypothetical protein
MKTELYKKVWIKSEADLPKEEGEYFCGEGSGLHYKHFSTTNFNNEEFWLKHIDWYLQPIEQIEQPEPSVQLTDEEIEKQITIICKDLIKQEYYTAWVHEEAHTRSRIIGFDEVAKSISKWYRDQIKVSLRDELMKCLEWLDDMHIIVLDDTPKATINEYLNNK